MELEKRVKGAPFWRLRAYLADKLTDGHYKTLKWQNAILKERYEQDPLTGIYNRRRLGRDLEKHISMYNRYGIDFSMIMMDIDNFKPVNDTYGHDTGDKILIQLAEHFCQQTRTEDNVYRVGGDEFSFLIMDSENQAYEFADRLRESVCKCYFEISVSAGIAGYKGQDGVLKRADEALYEAKNSGKNNIVICHENTPKLRCCRNYLVLGKSYFGS